MTSTPHADRLGPFLAMWLGMMVAMMLPALAPSLWRYRQAVGVVSGPRLALLTALVSSGYFLVWTIVGAAIFPVSVALAAMEMQHPAMARAAPFAAAVLIAGAGALQFTAWKARRLACCRVRPGRGRGFASTADTAWRHGVRLGIECCCCCGNLMAIALLMGRMDLRTMAAATAAIALERLAPDGVRAARVIGVAAVALGVLLVAQGARPPGAHVHGAAPAESLGLDRR